MLDGRLGFGQVIGEAAMRGRAGQCRKFGLSLVALRNSGHLGRIGDWAEMAAERARSRSTSSTPAAAASWSPRMEGPSAGSRPTRSRRACRSRTARRSSSTSRPARSPRARSRSRPTRGRRSPTVASWTVRAGRPTIHRRFTASPPGVILPLGGHKGYRPERHRRGAGRHTLGRFVQPARSQGRIQQPAGHRHRPAATAH